MKKECNRVFIIGIDGAGNAISEAHAPRIYNFLQNGAVTYSAQTVVPSISGECWGSLFHGVGPKKHGLTNTIADQQTYPEDSQYPSFMKLARSAWADCTLASFSNWNPINTGIIEVSSRCHLVSKSDKDIAKAVGEYLEKHDPTILFVQLDDVDHSGHQYDYRTKGYYEQIKKTDGYVGRILDAIDHAGYMEDSLVILCADHGGGGAKPKVHGSDHPLDTTIFWGCHGPGIQQGEIKTPVNIMDTAAVVAKAVGLVQPKEWDAKVPDNLFMDNDTHVL